MPSLRVPGEVPDCPLCGGPCIEEFERSEFVFPDRLKRSDDDPSRADDVAPKPKPANRRGKRAHKLAEDRMHRPAEDRSTEGPK